MEQYFRIALCMFFLIGYLQAKPVFSDLPMGKLHSEVHCNNNVTFTSPKNVQKLCHTAALECFKEGLEYASRNCQDENERINDTLNTLKKYSDTKSSSTVTPNPRIQKNSTECKWKNEDSHKTFEVFLNDFKNFIKLLNSEV